MRGKVVLLIVTGSAFGLASGCKLGEAEVVIRTPSAPKAEGGVTGQSTVPPQYVDAGATSDVASEGVLARDAARDARTNRDSAFTFAPDIADVIADTDASTATCASGAFVFCETFESGASRWTTIGGEWAVIAQNPDGTSHAYGPTDRTSTQSFAALPGWSDMTADARVLVAPAVQSSSARRAELFVRYVDPSHNYAVALRADGYLALRKNGTALGDPLKLTTLNDQWHVLKIRVSHASDATIVEGYLDGTLLLVEPDTDSDETLRGTVAVGVYGTMEALFDDVRVSVP